MNTKDIEIQQTTINDSLNRVQKDEIHIRFCRVKQFILAYYAFDKKLTIRHPFDLSSEKHFKLFSSCEEILNLLNEMEDCLTTLYVDKGLKNGSLLDLADSDKDKQKKWVWSEIELILNYFFAGFLTFDAYDDWYDCPEYM